MHLLKESFPSVQFIATTHSPLVASGAEAQVHHLSKGRSTVEHPFGWLAEDVYRMMGLPTSSAKPIEENLNEFKLLSQKSFSEKLTVTDKRRLKELRRKINDLPSSDPVETTTELDSIIKTLRNLHTNSAVQRHGNEKSSPKT